MLAGQQLKDLTVYPCPAVDLSKNVELRRVSLGPIFIDGAPQALPVDHILSTLSSTHIEEVILLIKLRDTQGSASRSIVDSLAAALERHVFAELKTMKLVLDVENESARHMVRVHMEEGLSSFSERGLLVFSN
jgi:hypothetical protein